MYCYFNIYRLEVLLKSTSKITLCEIGKYTSDAPRMSTVKRPIIKT